MIGTSLFVTISSFTDDSQDHARIAAQVLSGIGFFGAGIIMREVLNMRGFNTAATLWFSAAIGVLTGLNHLAKAMKSLCRSWGETQDSGVANPPILSSDGHCAVIWSS